ncbi:response regulator [Tropicimonas sediminicola]|uniref:response regulator n=1 Tax=Tropicimonas sediminicola TaxID=1031541 RepID=UPI000B790938|nr:response regulator [Tropicimonas sediminicola]
MAPGARRELEVLRGQATELARTIGRVLDARGAPDPAPVRWSAEPPFRTVPATSCTEADVSGIRVLLCRPEGSGQAALGQMLRHLGAIVTPAVDVADAMNRLATQTFDVMILQLPDRPGAVDGMLGEIRKMDGPQAAIPVVAVATGRGVPDAEMLGVLGVGAVLETPIMDVGVLGRTLACALGREKGPDPDPSCALRLEHLLHLAGDGPRTEILVQLESDLAATHEALQEAVKSGDFEPIRKAAHVLVALAGTAGAVGLEEAARDIGQLAREGDAMPEIRGLACRMRQDIDGLRASIRKLVARHDGAGAGDRP